jgi:hypothetical protein
MLAAGRDPDTRAAAQEALGVSLLPLYWRTPPDASLGVLAWRPAALAAHEVVRQHDALVQRLARGERWS